MVLSPEKPARSKPVEAMAKCGPLPQLSEELSGMELEAALHEILRTKLKGDDVYRACMLRHADLVRWIEAE